MLCESPPKPMSIVSVRSLETGSNNAIFRMLLHVCLSFVCVRDRVDGYVCMCVCVGLLCASTMNGRV